MNAGWILGTIFALVMTFTGICQSGLFSSSPVEEKAKITTRPAKEEELFSTESGWRYQRGQPNHWKYMMMKK